jgi:hypothetical protein
MGVCWKLVLLEAGSAEGLQALVAAAIAQAGRHGKAACSVHSQQVVLQRRQFLQLLSQVLTHTWSYAGD